MTNILIIVPKLSGGGAEKVAANLSIELSKYYNVHIAVFDSRFSTYETKGEIHNLCLTASNNPIKKIYNVLMRTKKVSHIKKKNNIKTSISFLDGPHLVNILSGKNDFKIVSIRNHISMENKSYFRLMLLKFIFHKANLIVSISEEVKRNIIELKLVKSDKIKVIYNSVDYITINNKSLEKCNYIFDPQKKYIVNVGRLCDQKGQWNLIRIFHELCKKRDDLVLIIIGSGEYENKLRDYCDFLGIGDKVNLLGFLSNPYPIIKNSTIFAFSSIFEGLGNSLLEALALNIPIISTDCLAGPREIIAPDYNDIETTKFIISDFGILTPKLSNIDRFSYNELTKSQLEFYHGLNLLLNNDTLREQLRLNASSRIRDFSVEIITEKWLEIIERKIGD